LDAIQGQIGKEAILRTNQRLVVGFIALSVMTGVPAAKADTDYNEAINEAALKGDVAAVKKLLQKNPALVHEVHRATKLSGFTPLHYAAQAGNKNLVRLLIAYKADVNYKKEGGDTPLEVAAWWGKKDVAELFLAKGAQLNIFTAAALGKTDQVTAFLRADRKLIHAQRADGRTALHWAAYAGEKATVKLLLVNKADVNSNAHNKAWYWHRSPLHDAASQGHKAVAELLIARKANINARDDRGRTPLHLAVAYEHKEVVELLLIKGANVNAQINGYYLGPGAFHPKGVSAVSLLTPLHLAAQHGNKALVKLLIAHKAKVNAQDQGGQTPLDLALDSNYKAVANLLRKHGGIASIGKKDK
jgi:cytohesin